VTHGARFTLAAWFTLSERHAIYWPDALGPRAFGIQSGTIPQQREESYDIVEDSHEEAVAVAVAASVDFYDVVEDSQEEKEEIFDRAD